jgi:ABC-2 type transport system permease protein
MKYALLVALREYAESAKAKGFWIGIFLMPTILFLSIQAPIWLEKKATPVRNFLVVDQSGELAGPIEKRIERDYEEKMFEAVGEYARKYAGTNLNRAVFPGSADAFIAAGGKEAVLKKLQPSLKSDAPPFQEPRRAFRAVKLPAGVDPEGDLNALAESLKPWIRGEKQIEVDGQWVDLSAAVLIPKDVQDQVIRPGAKPTRPATNAEAANGEHATRNASASSGIQFWTINNSDPRLHDEIEHAISSEIHRREYLARGLDASVVRQVEQTFVPIKSLNPKKEKGKEAVSTIDTVKQWAPSGFVYLLWLSIFIIIQMLLNNTIEEKSNRIIEVLLSSVTPGELMMGKLFGIAAIGLTMVGAWMLFLFGILSWKAGGPADIATQLLTILKGSNLVLLFSVYFLLGYLMYAGFILSIGSVCNTLKEAQSYMGVLTMVMMVPILTMTFIPKDPNGPLARVLSWIPIYTPFTMMNRASADPPAIDMVGTFVLLIATTALAMWMSGKVFRIGILRTGQPPKVLEMIRWAVRKRE